MASVYIVPRTTRNKGTRYSVRCEIHNKPIIRLGTFSEERHAWSRKIAALDVISKHATDQAAYDALISERPAEATLTVREACDAWLATREHDARENTLKAFRQIIRETPAWLAGMDARRVTHIDAQRFVGELAATYKRGTIARRLGILRMVLKYHGVDPNPAADPRVKLPRGEERGFRLPTKKQLEHLHAVLPARKELMIFLWWTGLRIEEAARLRWSDFDRAKDRFLVQQAKTKAGKRWVDRLPGSPPFPTPKPGDDPDALVFRNPGAGSLTGSLRWAALNRGAFLLSAHDFRHGHASRLMHEQQLSPAQIAARLGHTNTSVLHDVYVHIVPPD